MADELIIPENITDADRESWTSPEDVGVDSAASVVWRKLLKAVDPRLDLMYFKPNATAVPYPDRWYIVRRNELAPDAFWVIQDEEGNYSPMTERHFERFRKGDSAANPNLWRDMQWEIAAQKLAAEREFEEKRREFREKLSERLDHVYGTQVAISPAMYAKLRSRDA